MTCYMVMVGDFFGHARGVRRVIAVFFNDRLRSRGLGQGWLGLYGRKSALDDRHRLNTMLVGFFLTRAG